MIEKEQEKIVEIQETQEQDEQDFEKIIKEGEQDEEVNELPSIDANEDNNYEQLKECIDNHFNNLRNLIKYVKSKDETIYQLSTEIQKYREGYCNKIFKSIAGLLISFREDCRKAYYEMGQYDLEEDKIKKYMKFLTDNYEELLSEIGCEEYDNEWRYNGKSLAICETKGQLPNLFEKEDSVLQVVSEEATEKKDIKDYLILQEEKIQSLLKDNDVLDKTLNAYVKYTKNIEEGIVFGYIYPSLRKLVSLNKEFKELVSQNIQTLNEYNKYEKYNECLLFMINKLEDVLLSEGVSIYTTVDDTFDVKRNRLLRTIETNSLEKDRIIAKQYTECYVLNEAVIYPSKVDVYKYVEEK